MTKNLFVVLDDEIHHQLKILSAEDSQTIRSWITNKVKDYWLDREGYTPERLRNLIRDTFKIISRDSEADPEVRDAIFDEWKIQMQKLEPMEELK